MSLAEDNPPVMERALALALLEKIRMQQQGHVDTAELFLRQIVESCPDFPDVIDALTNCLYQQAVALFQTARYAEALSALRDIQTLRPAFPELNKSLALVLYQHSLLFSNEGQMLKAELLNEEALSLQPDFPAATQLRQHIAAHSRHIRRAEPQNPEEREIMVLAQRARMDRNRDTKQIIMVCETFRARALKIARALKKAGKDVIFLYQNEPNFLITDIGFHAVPYKDAWDALRLATTFRPAAFHVFSSAIDLTAIVFVRGKPGPVIFDYQDIFPGLVPGNAWNSRGYIGDWQTQALNESDGVCCQDLQYRAAARINKWEPNKNMIWFPHYVEESLRPHPRPQDDALRLISTGYIQDPEGTLKKVEGIFRPLVEAGINIDIFVTPDKRHLTQTQVEDAHRNLLDLSNTRTQVKVHTCVPPDILQERQRDYDCGLILNVDPEIKGAPPYYTQHYFSAGLSGRVADFLTSGLVVLGTPELKMSRFIARRYGYWLDTQDVLAPGGIERLKEVVRRSKTVSSIPPSFFIDHHIHRLIRFYERIGAAVPAAMSG
ncbi:MAG: hypothetical protein P4M13_10860 [Alphaproteobacteria bacterium]|nr:hypothetical protein [Alphaproteobacteria bacterium]